MLAALQDLWYTYGPLPGASGLNVDHPMLRRVVRMPPEQNLDPTTELQLWEACVNNLMASMEGSSSQKLCALVVKRRGYLSEPIEVRQASQNLTGTELHWKRFQRTRNIHQAIKCGYIRPETPCCTSGCHSSPCPGL